MKARPVDGLRPRRSFRSNAARVIAVRLDELYAFDPALRDPAAVRSLHDMRIAAKRLRYVLQIAGFPFGGPAAEAEEAAERLQQVLGEIHDCDVLLPLVDARLAELRGAAARDLTEASGGGAYGADRLARGLVRLPADPRATGLETLGVTLVARRAALYDAFVHTWDGILASGLRARIEAALRHGG